MGEKIATIVKGGRMTLGLAETCAGLLKERGATLAVAESCTGGRLAAVFTALAGASDYFQGGAVAYSNEVKACVLGVSREDLERYGAVSRQVAEQMALGACRVFGADYAISTTGIAGPGGGSVEKPVGTVWVAVVRNYPHRQRPAYQPQAGAEKFEEDNTVGGTVCAKLFHFTGSREEVMEQSVAAGMEMLRVVLM